MLDVMRDALPAIVAFMSISLLTFIGWGIRRVYIFAHSMQQLIEKEMTNGQPAGQGESTKDILTGIRSAILNHDTWARADAERRNAALEEHHTILKENQEILRDLNS